MAGNRVPYARAGASGIYFGVNIKKKDQMQQAVDQNPSIWMWRGIPTFSSVQNGGMRGVYGCIVLSEGMWSGHHTYMQCMCGEYMYGHRKLSEWKYVNNIMDVWDNGNSPNLQDMHRRFQLLGLN